MAVRGVSTENGTTPVALDCGAFGQWDSSLLVFVIGLRQSLSALNINLDESGLPPAASGLLALVNVIPTVVPRAATRTNLLESVGKPVLAIWANILEVTALVGDTVLRGGSAALGRVKMRRSDLLSCMQDAGLGALPIVAVVNVLVGGILAFVGAVQLRKFGADIFIANLVGVAMVREMAALRGCPVLC